MTVTVFDAARRVCERGSWKITNLGLQKMLYLAQMLYMGEHDGARLFETDFEAWDYGPVSPPLYRKVRMFGADPIQDVFFSCRPVQDKERSHTLDAACEYLIGKKPSELVAITHWDRGAWAKNYIPGVRGIVIPDKDILDEYKERAAA